MVSVLLDLIWNAQHVLLNFNLKLLAFARWKVIVLPPTAFSPAPATYLYFVRGANFATLKQSLWSYYMVRCLMEPLKSLWGSCCFIYFLIKDNPFCVAPHFCLFNTLWYFYACESSHSSTPSPAALNTCCLPPPLPPTACVHVCDYRKEWEHLPGACAAVVWNGIVSLGRQTQTMVKNGTHFFF